MNNNLDNIKINKINNYINNNLNNINNIIIKNKKIIYFNIPGKPENYVRERKGRGNRFYNKKESQMRNYKMLCLKQLSKEDYNFIHDAIDNNNENYTIEIEAKYYYPIPKGDSIRLSALKAMGLIEPTIRIDLDNYDKFLLDSLHDVLYDDDKHVVSIKSTKQYALEPRTEVTATIIQTIIKKEE